MNRYNWLRSELFFNLRYTVMGVMNTLVGLMAIWLFTRLGAMPMIANALGYGVGLSVAFLGSRYLVFQSKGPARRQGWRFVHAFIVSYLLNLLVLQLAYRYFGFDVMFSQVLANGAYIVCMYALQRMFVFRR